MQKGEYIPSSKRGDGEKNVPSESWQRDRGKRIPADRLRHSVTGKRRVSPELFDQVTTGVSASSCCQRCSASCDASAAPALVAGPDADHAAVVVAAAASENCFEQ